MGGALPAAQWTACVASVVTIQLLSAMLSLLIKMLLLVTGFEANGTEMFESFALLTCAPTAGLVLMGIDRAIRAGCTNRCCSFLRHVVRFVVGLGLMLGSVYYLVFLFGGISTYTLSHLDTAWWDLTCVLLSMTASFYIAIELMRLATGYKANAKQTPSRNEQDQALADVVQAGLESEHEEKQENRAVITLTWALQAVDEEDEREAEAKARKPVDLRPQHVVERQGSDSTSSRRCLAAFRGCGLFWVELGLWILERQYVATLSLLENCSKLFALSETWCKSLIDLETCLHSLLPGNTATVQKGKSCFGGYQHWLLLYRCIFTPPQLIRIHVCPMGTPPSTR